MKQKNILHNPLLKRLSPKKHQVFTIISKYVAEHQVPPTVEFVRSHLTFDIKHGTLYEHILAMERHGYLRKWDKKWWPTRSGVEQRMIDYDIPRNTGLGTEDQETVELRQDSVGDSPESVTGDAPRVED